MADEKDFLDELIDEGAAEDGSFPAMVEAAYRRRQLLKALGEERRRLKLSQTKVAARMATSQSQLVRLEAGEADPRLSTLERYAVAVGRRIEWSLVEATPPKPRSRRRAQATA